MSETTFENLIGPKVDEYEDTTRAYINENFDGLSRIEQHVTVWLNDCLDILGDLDDDLDIMYVKGIISACESTLGQIDAAK